jgi:hypothetical protein
MHPAAAPTPLKGALRHRFEFAGEAHATLWHLHGIGKRETKSSLTTLESFKNTLSVFQQFPELFIKTELIYFAATFFELVVDLENSEWQKIIIIEVFG